MRLNSFLLLCISFLSINILMAQHDQLTNHTDHHDHDRCGFIHATQRMLDVDPDYAQKLDDYMKKGLPMLSSGEHAKSVAPTITIPVVVHVIHNGEPVGSGANIADGQVQAQIAVLNEDFAALNGNYNNTPSQWQNVIGNPEMEFCLANVDPSGNPTNGITRNNITVTGTNANDHNIEDIKAQINWNPNNYYNIFVVGIPGTTANGGVLGYAYLPFAGTIGSSNDGTVCDYHWFGGPGWPNTGSKTMTHETGHYLGLSHTWQDVWGNGGCAGDDGIADTPLIEMATSQVNPNFNCFAGYPAGPVSCGNEHMYVNYMDYVNDDGCYTSFTQGQVNVMRAVMDGTAGSLGFGSRLPLANNSSTACSNIVSDDAGITVVINPIGQNCGTGSIIPQVTLANFGTNALTSVTISYTIDGGTPTTFNWTGNLAQNATTNVTLPAFTPPPGVYTFNAFTTNPNGVADQDASNDATTTTSSSVTATNIPLFEDFETFSWDPSAQGVFPFNVGSDPFMWELTTLVSGYGSGSNSAVFNNYDGNNTSNPFNTVDALITPTYDFSNVVGATLSFDYAYSGYDDGTQYLGDSLIILISTDCGTTFSQRIYENGGVTLETAPGGTAKFTPTANQWATESISLAAFDNTATLTISFLNWSGWGNQLFLDNINISTACALTSSISGNNLMCNGVCTGTATATANNAVGSVTYAWNDNASQTTATATNLCAGTYTVTITDAANCSETQIITITEPTTALTSLATGTAETSLGANDGTATVTPTGGTAPYTYAWSNGMTAQSITGLAPNTYTVVVTDNNNCTSNASYTVLPFNCPAINAAVTPIDISCMGAADGSATATVTGGVPPHTFAWSNGQTGATTTGLVPGAHSVVITDGNQCTTTLNTTINEPTAVTASATATDETAIGTNDGTASVVGGGGTPGYTYAWSNGMTTAMVSNLAPGTYTVVVTDANNCNSTTTSVTVAAFNCPLLNLVVTGTDVSCNGAGDGTASASFNGGTGPWTYSWDNGMTTQTITGLNGGTYTVVLTDGSNCTETASVTIAEPSAIIVTATATDETANSANDGTATATVSGGATPYTYSWNTGATTASISNLAAGTYTVVVTDANNCSTTESTTVNGVSCTGFAATLSTTNISCFGASNGTVNVAPTGGTAPYTYSWNNGATTQMISNLPIGTYSVVITDASNCSVTESATISEPMALVANVIGTNETSAGANDGTATASGQGGTSGYTYSWSNGATTANISGLSPGTYTVDVTDSNNCTASTSVTILSGSNPCSGFNTSTTNTNASCNGGNDGSSTVVLNGGTAPYTYIWNNGQTTQTITGLAAGIFTVTVTDANNCPVEMSSTVSEPSQIVVTVSGTDETSAGANDGTLTANVVGGTPGVPGYTYLWSNGMTTQTISNLAPGNYDVVVMDSNDCSMQESGIVLQGAASCAGFNGTTNAINVSCFGLNDGTAEAVVNGGTGPFTYQWSDGQTTQIAVGLTAGNYEVSIFDVNQCAVQLATTITEPTSLAVNINGTDETAQGASDGMLTATVSGGIASYTYAWSNGATTATIANLVPGNYTVSITDANGCVSSGAGTVLAGASACAGFGGTITKTDANCNGFNDGTATANLSGGTMPYTYLWSDGQSTQIASQLVAGSYEVTVSDINSCSTVLTVTVNEPTAISPNITATDETTPGANDGELTASPSGGIPGYTYLWSNNLTTATVNNLMPGAYTVTITDDVGCTTLGVGAVLPAQDQCAGFNSNIDVTHVTCNGLANGMATAQVFGGTMPYTYQWSNGQTSVTATGLGVGNHSVIVLDANQCPINLNFAVSEPLPVFVTVSHTNETTPGAADGSATVNGSGGTMPYTYLWDTGATTQTINNLTVGTYLVTITDANNCMNSQSVSINSNGANCAGFDLAANSINVSCFNGADGSASASVTGGTIPYTYIWSNGMTAPSISNLISGTYIVTATDATGCIVSETIMVTQPSAIQPNIVGIDGECGINGSASVSPQGGFEPYSYLWSNGEVTNAITNLSAGAYSVVITDGAGCSVTANTSITVDANFVSFDVVKENISCAGENDGMIDLTVLTGTAPYTFLWDNGMTTEDISGLAAGSYMMTITDANGCAASSNILINSPDILEVNLNTINVSDNNNGMVMANPVGGTSPFTYLWSNNVTTQMNSNLTPGMYSVTVTDANQCTAVNSTIVEDITSVETIETLTNLEVYPNPTRSLINIEATFTTFEVVEIHLMNVVGQNVWTKNVDGNSLIETIEVTAFPAGTYLLKIGTDTGQVIEKITIVK